VLQAGSTSPDLVAIEARNAVAGAATTAAQATAATDENPLEPGTVQATISDVGATVISLPVRRAFPPDPRPLPSVDIYDRLLKRTPKGTA
jgi:hypothetical protein